MEQKILAGLKHLGYNGPLNEKGNLKTSIEYGVKNIEYTKLIHYLTNELRTLSNIDEAVNPISGPEDSSAFVMEITSFLKELNCPYKSLTQGHASDRLQNLEDRQLLLDYLITELMSARIMDEVMPKKKIELKLQETREAMDLKQILMTLGFSRPPADITVQMLFQKLLPSVENLVKRAGDELIGKPFFTGFLSEKQWQILDDLQKDLNNEYKIRREMLLTRLDVTIQSFQWSDRSKGKENQFERIYKDKRKTLTVNPDVDISHLLAARNDIAIIEKTSSSKVRKNTGTSLHKVIIGQVPDRGGRTNELAPPPPEMPSWQQRTPGPAGGQRGGYNRGGGRGQQSYSRGGFQASNERGNNNVGYGTNTSSGGGGFKSFTNIRNDKKPFSNFDTSLSLYASSSTSTFSSNKGIGESRFTSGTSRNAYSKPFDSAGSYDNPNKRHRSSSNNDYDRSSSFSQKRSFELAGDTDDRGNYAGNYGDGRNTNYDSKKPKSYDNFQTSQSTYSDQYVQDAQNNQQYHQRRGSGRGRSNYHRGGGSGRGQGNNYR